MKQKTIVERKTMPVKGGEAWVKIATYPNGKVSVTKWMQKDADGVIREKERVHVLDGSITGDCPECKQMPCPHTARLLGWPVK